MGLTVTSWDDFLKVMINDVEVSISEEELRDIVSSTKKEDLGCRTSQPEVIGEVSTFRFSFKDLEIDLKMNWTSQEFHCGLNNLEVTLSRMKCLGSECLILGMLITTNKVYFLILSINERRAVLHLLVLDINSFINEIIFYKLNKKFKVTD